MKKYGVVVYFTMCCLMKLSVGYKDTLNVGTTLFRPKDVGRKCWSDEEIALVSARMIVQELVPKHLNELTDGDVDDYLSYSIACLDYASRCSEGENRNVMEQVMADVLGGFASAELWPRTKSAFYEGGVGYNETKRLDEFLRHVKNDVLETNGGHWKKPKKRRFVRSDHIILYETPMYHTTRHCVDLITFKKNGTAGLPFVIPTPFLDNEENPSSMGIPMKPSALVSLKEPYVLKNFYNTSNMCMAEFSNSRADTLHFNNDLYEWIEASVLPHLNDEEWYPAFGDVLRIFGTMEKLGAGPSELKHQLGHGQNETYLEVADMEDIEKSRERSDLRKLLLIILGVALVVLVLLCIPICGLIIRHRKKQKEKDMENGSEEDVDSDDQRPGKTFVDIYYGMKDKIGGKSEYSGVSTTPDTAPTEVTSITSASTSLAPSLQDTSRNSPKSPQKDSSFSPPGRTVRTPRPPQVTRGTETRKKYIPPPRR